MRKLFTVAAFVAASLFAVPTAGADVTGMSVAVGSTGTLVAGVYVVVPVTVTCVTDEASIATDSIQLDLRQKSGRTLVEGGGGISYQSPLLNGIGFGTPVTCDGQPHTYALNVFPIGDGAFKGGKAVVVSALFNISTFSFENFFAAAPGPTTINIKGGGG
jgi:hypothetical protein